MDIRNLENLKAFSSFVDFLENPGKYRTLLDEAKEVVKQFYEGAGFARSVAELREWKQIEEQGFSFRERDLLKREEAVEKVNLDLEYREAELHKEYTDKEAKLKLKEDMLKQRETAVLDLEAQSFAIEKLRLEYTRDLQALEKQRKDLRERENALKAVLG